MIERKEVIAYCMAFPNIYEHWNSIILDGTVSLDDIRRMIEESYDLTNQ